MPAKAGWFPMIGRTLGRYRIVEKIGEGGMGVVYRARDEHLNRDVAIKVLPAGMLTDEAARRRFRKEAEALARLSHTHIGHVYDFDTQDGVDFLVMEHISGTTLGEQLKAGVLPEERVVAIGAQLTAALEEAHERGIVHRDLKPGNVLLMPKGQAKVLDFGLARLLQPGGATEAAQTLTQTTEVAAGTLPYMAPEQLRGEPADARTDIYAAGVVLYEMATGRPPFDAKLPTALAGDIQHTLPKPPRQLNPRLSPRLEEVILKCLEKNPENRYQSAKELGVDLRRLAAPSSVTVAVPSRLGWPQAMLAAGIALVALLAVLVGLNVGGWRDRLLGRSTTPRITSLAILPLENLSHDPEQEYFADGMTEALISDLGKIGTLRVISRFSVMRYKGTRKPPQEIASELNVEALVVGSVLRSGQRVRISPQLVRVATQDVLWSENYERDLQDVLTLQSEVARAIASGIKVRLTQEEKAQLSRAGSVNPEAHEAYLKGRYYWNKRSAEEVRKAIGYFQLALEKDPTYAVAYAGLADCYNFLSVASIAAISPQEAFPKGRAAAKRALELDDTLAEAHAALAFATQYYEWDWPAAEREYKRALELRPGYPIAHQWYSHYLMMVKGEPDQSLAEARRARELDPLALPANVNLCWQLYFARRYDQAVVQCQKTLDLDPNFFTASWILGLAEEQRGRATNALAALERAVELSARDPTMLGALAYAYAVFHRANKARRILHELDSLSSQKYVPAYALAEIYAGLGEKDKAFSLLEKAFEERSIQLVFLKVNPRLDSLRPDPRFQDLLHRIGLPR